MSCRAGTVQGHPATAPASDNGAGGAFRAVLRMSALDLAPLDTAVPSARLHARHVVREWGLADLAADCELIVAELVTNAIDACARLPAVTVPPPVRLRLTGRPHGVQIEVWDACDDLPDPHRDRPADEPGGWGLTIVTALSSRWGTYRTEGGGKCVWAVTGT
jgi:anti-sigma regulatory factor (Ser/Thr protein kinase)